MSDNAESRNRLWAMRDHLKLQCEIDDPGFDQELISAAKTKIRSVPNIQNCRTGESLADTVALHLGITFEEVRSERDIDELTQKYLKKNEIGFGQLSLELKDPNVDALLLKRSNARESDSDRYVAVLNLQGTDTRAFWNRIHEVSHRVTEPPQHSLALYRHRANQKNRVEHLVDLVAAEIGFFEPIFKPVVLAYADEQLSWEIVESIRAEFAPTASLMSTAKAILRHWPNATVMLNSEFRGRKKQPTRDQALRTSVAAWSPSFDSRELFFYPNMRVPVTSPIYHSYISGSQIDDLECLDEWSTSSGKALPAMRVFTSTRRYGKGNLALISLL